LLRGPSPSTPPPEPRPPPPRWPAHLVQAHALRNLRKPAACQQPRRLPARELPHCVVRRRAERRCAARAARVRQERRLHCGDAVEHERWLRGRVGVGGRLVEARAAVGPQRVARAPAHLQQRVNYRIQHRCKGLVLAGGPARGAWARPPNRALVRGDDLGERGKGAHDRWRRREVGPRRRRRAQQAVARGAQLLEEHAARGVAAARERGAERGGGPQDARDKVVVEAPQLRQLEGQQQRRRHHEHLLHAHAQRAAHTLKDAVEQRRAAQRVAAAAAAAAAATLARLLLLLRGCRRPAAAAVLAAAALAEQRGHELALPRERLVRPRHHVCHVAPRVVRVDLDRRGHAAGAPARERDDEALEQRAVARARDLLGAVLEEHGPLAQRGDGRGQRGVDLGRVVLAQVAALGLDPPAGARVGGWPGGWVGGWVGGWAGGWVGGWVGGRVGGWVGGWAGGRVG
jgi:hypothetical protein